MSEETEATCPICNQIFKNKAGLQGHMRLKHPDQPSPDDEPGRAAETKSTAVTRKGQSSVEGLIQELTLPDVANGQATVFDAGVGYGMRSVLIGVRVAQELCAMGVQQAVPLIKMAQEMRESEEKAARLLAGEFADATLQANSEVKVAISELSHQMRSSGGNPMMAYLMPLLMPEIEKLMTRFSGGAAGNQTEPQPQTETGAPPPAGEPAQQASPLVERHSLDEWEEDDV